MNTVDVAFCGPLHHDHDLQNSLTALGARFVRQDRTDKHYRCWSIEDGHPGLQRCPNEKGNHIALEIWSVPVARLGELVMQAAMGQCLGRVVLANETQVLGWLVEPWLVTGQREITGWGSWQTYLTVFESCDCVG